MAGSRAEQESTRPTDAKLKELWPDRNPEDVSFPQPKRPRPSAAKETAMELLREEAEKQGVCVIEEEPLPESGLVVVPDNAKSH